MTGPIWPSPGRPDLRSRCVARVLIKRTKKRVLPSRGNANGSLLVVFWHKNYQKGDILFGAVVNYCVRF